MKFRGGKFFVLTILLAGFFSMRIALIYKYAHTNTAKAEGRMVVINEIAWMGMTASSGDEFIELKNLTSEDISLEGWKLSAQDGTPEINLSGIITANGYYLLERTDDDTVAGIQADLIYAGALGNDGEVLNLIDASESQVDAVDASTGWQAGENASKKTMERKIDGAWQTSTSVGGTPKMENSSPSPPPSQEEQVCGNGILESGEDCDDSNVNNDDGCASNCKNENNSNSDDSQNNSDNINNDSNEASTIIYGLGDAVINEFVSDPSDGSVEWVEILNNKGKDIDLNGWYLEDGSGAKTSLSGKLGSTSDSRFKVVENIKGNLNNAGDIIKLRDKKNNLIDQVAYGNWEDGDLGNNALAASDPCSLARAIDGHSTYSNFNDFKVTKNITKGRSNIIEEIKTEKEEEINEEEKKNYDYSSDILITEIFPNPAGDDEAANNPKKGEFVELYNQGERDVNLKGWKVGDSTTKKFDIGNLNEFKNNKANAIIKAKSYLVIYRAESKTVLNNDSDSVKLFRPLEENAFQAVDYKGAIEGFSYARIKETEFPAGNSVSSASDWEWTEIVTPEKENIIKPINHPPVVDFDCPESVNVNTPVIFDSSDTSDPDGDKLEFSWDFGDSFKSIFASPDHVFMKEGSFVVKLIVNDGVNKVEKEKIIKVLTSPSPSPSQGEGKINSSHYEGEGKGGVFINEFLPNPEGDDAEGEWIELKNNSLARINLLNWKLDDDKDGSQPYVFKSDTWIEVENFLLAPRSQSKLALNNTTDSIRLYNNFNELIDEVSYEESPEGEAYARGLNDKWFWTTTLTPEEENIITVSNSSSKPEVSSGGNAKSSSSKKVNTYIETALGEVSQIESGDFVKVKGAVSVLPGVFGSQYFYIVSVNNATSTDTPVGIQVYNNKKDFPALQIGDEIEVSGEISVSYGEKRIKTKTKDDMVKITSGEEPVPTVFGCDKINDSLAGSLVKISGEVTSRKASNIWLDDGMDEALVYIKSLTGISAADYKAGDKLEITGIIGLTNQGARLMPRDKNDIIRKDNDGGEAGQVLGEVAVSDEWDIAQRNKKIELFKYLLIIASGVIVVLGGLLFRQMRK